ncbi:similar to JmjC domain-containing histone demethylation protein 1 [Plenodomus lingam JN3]|uniref:JmjC domain-containing histone demethylation protein 1 n=2 Tax=Leptosphaeria maculans TaxID=5022 RepID=E5AF81_LEPMJ|nr:similar to JmjC domain-containing histone demethylation protein 1 [Plenodomus lingam JN3]CBY01870.1 similar to JmjC domain-containing histone demethylation protein 1 [Plenodomus lingam JN3]
MRRISSFKAQYRQTATRAPTPPPPVYEPLSPVLAATKPPRPHPAGHVQTATMYSINYTNGAASITPTVTEKAGVRMPLSSSVMPLDASLGSAAAPPQPPPHHTLAQTEPIEALADAAITSSQQQQPPCVEPRRHAVPAPHAASSPTPTHTHTAAAHASSSSMPPHSFAPDTNYALHERPAKRARSELYASPHHGQPQSRPATSHIPGSAYHVNHMVDGGMRIHQDNSPSAPQQSRGGEDRISDAQLLLDFFTVSAHTAKTPPSTAKRWSLPNAPELAHPAQPMFEPISPNAAAPSSSELCFPSPHAPQPAQQAPAAPHPTLTEPESAQAAQTHTPPEDPPLSLLQPGLAEGAAPLDEPKKKHQGWPKGKPRGPRSTPSTSKRKRATPKPKGASSGSASGPPSQLESPQSLAADQLVATSTNAAPLLSLEDGPTPVASSQARRHSFSGPRLALPDCRASSAYLRAQSLPLGAKEATPTPVHTLRHRAKKATVEQPDLICAACKSSESEIKVGDGEQWIGCDGCKEWYHYACAGFSSEREVRDVNKFYCEQCRPKFGATTKVRKSIRAHTAVDYAGLNEGVLKTSDDNPEHHYISAFKNGDIEFVPETFARIPAELITADFLEKSNGFKEPILTPASLNSPSRDAGDEVISSEPNGNTQIFEYTFDSTFETETVPDDGQDSLDMVIPKGLTVRRVAELYGANEPVPVIDVKAQEGEGKKWTMGKWADYYEQQGEKPVRNVISLEVSRSRLGKLIRRPKAVRDMDLQDAVWRADDKFAPPPVQFYCLMSVADCFTDFHIDFGGSSVYYHIVKGRKVFFFIPPTKQNLKKYEDWCLSPNQGHEWLGKQVKECYRVDLHPGDTMLIPSGWIHAVWTPEDSLVIGGNFLTRIHYGMQIKVLEIEKNTKVASQFRYPFFQKIMWLAAIKYLQEDPVPEPVQQLLQNSEKFERSVPIYCEPDRFGHNSHLGAATYNRRYYSKHELEGLTDLLNYIWRTVLITEGKLDVPQRTKAAVQKSIPKGHGEPLMLARQLAMWIAWKRGNETIPTWALSNALLPEVAESEKKLSAAQVRKLERETLNEALRATAERSSARIRASDVVKDPTPPDVENIGTFDDMTPSSVGPLIGFLRPSASNPHITTPKTSQLGPKRVACDACRKRRIRCKHKDELIDTSKPGMHTIDLSGSYGISVKRRLSDHSVTESLANSVHGPVNGGPIMADVNGDPYALKSGRVKACADCRKSKRRCIHDEYGNVDPIKANEVPIPRGSASKKRRVSDEDRSSTAKRMKHESSYDEEYMNGNLHTRHSLPNQYSRGSFSLQDIAYSAQQALEQSPEDNLVPVDPALHAYTNGVYNGDYTHMSAAYPSNGDSVMSSVEYQADEGMLMDGIELHGHNSEPHGPSIEPLTPGPLAAASKGQIQSHAHSPKALIRSQELRHPSSSISPRHVTAASPTADPYQSYLTSPALNNYNTFTTNSDFPPPPITPVANSLRSVRYPNSSGPKPRRTPSRGGRGSKTPKSTSGGRRTDSKDGIKFEYGLAVGMAGMIDPNLDQASINLIKQLQQEDLGLRRRSR